MKNFFRLFFLWAGILPIFMFFTSCHPEKEEIITKRIQYDVNIKSPNPNYDWWIQNLVGPQREKLVKIILAGALSGKVNVYDYFFQPLNKMAVARILSDTLAIKIREPYPPYAEKDSLVISHIGINDILKLRFLETWRINTRTLQFTKVVNGIAPVARRIDAEGKIRWQPLFWIIPNSKTAEELQQIN